MKPFDVSKFRKRIDKNVPGMSHGFFDPTTWLDTGCIALNYLISGHFDGGVPLEGKFTMFAGDSGCLPAEAKVRIRFADHTKEVTVGDLRSMVASGAYDIEIDTPDGFQPIVQWFEKGILQTVQVDVDNGPGSRCAFNHPLQKADGSWVHAHALQQGDELIARQGIVTVTGIADAGEAECYDFEVGHPNHRYWGDDISSHNSGKSYIAAANLIKDAQRKGIFPILIDTENAADASWMKPLGVDISEDMLIKLKGSTVDDVAKSLGEVFDMYKEENNERPYEDRPKLLIVIDSLGMMITPNQERQFNEGDQKGDMGIKAKQITNMVRVMMSKIGNQPIGMVGTNHVYDSQDQYKPDTISGGKMLEYATSVLVQMNKYLLKEDEHGNKLTDGQVAGVKSTCVVRKSRYAKPFEKIVVNIPYTHGMDPYSGMFDLFEKKGLILKDGARYTYTSYETGEIRKDWRKNFKSSGILDQIVAEQGHWDKDEAEAGFDHTGTTEDDNSDQ